MTAHVDELQKEIFIIRIAVRLAAQRLDLVVDSLDLPSRDVIGRMRDDSVKMREQEFPKPHQARIPFFRALRTPQAKIHDAVDVSHHPALVPAGERFLEHLLDEVGREQQLVLGEDALVAAQVADAFALDFRHGKDFALLAEDFPLAGFAVLPFQRCTARGQDVLASLQHPCGFVISGILQALLLVLPDFAHDLVVEVLDDVEIVEDHPEVRALLHERLLEVRVHVKGNSIDMGHPFEADVLDEVVDDLLLLSLCNPEDMPRLHVDDVCRELVAVVQLEFVDAEETSLPFRTDELPAFDVTGFQPTLVDGLHDVLVEAGQLADLLVGVRVLLQEVAYIGFQLLRDAVVLRLERDFLHLRMAALRAEILDVTETQAAVRAAERQMSQRFHGTVVDVHMAAAFGADTIRISGIQSSIQAEARNPSRRKFLERIRVVKTFQERGNQQVFLLRRIFAKGQGLLLETKLFSIIHREDIPLCGFTFARCISTSYRMSSFFTT